MLRYVEGGEKWSKELLDRLGIHPDAGVGDLDLDRAIVATSGHGYRAAIGGEFYGVQQQVIERVAHLGRIKLGFTQLRRKLQLERLATNRNEGPYVVGCRGEKLAQIHGISLQLLLEIAGGEHGDDLVDQMLQAFGGAVDAPEPVG